MDHSQTLLLAEAEKGCLLENTCNCVNYDSAAMPISEAWNPESLIQLHLCTGDQSVRAVGALDTEGR